MPIKLYSSISPVILKSLKFIRPACCYGTSIWPLTVARFSIFIRPVNMWVVADGQREVSENIVVNILRYVTISIAMTLQYHRHSQLSFEISVQLFAMAKVSCFFALSDVAKRFNHSRHPPLRFYAKTENGDVLPCLC